MEPGYKVVPKSRVYTSAVHFEEKQPRFGKLGKVTKDLAVIVMVNKE